MEIDRQTIADAKAKLGDRNADLIAALTGMEHYDSNRRVGCYPNPDHEDSTPSCSYNPRGVIMTNVWCESYWDLLPDRKPARRFPIDDWKFSVQIKEAEAKPPTRVVFNGPATIAFWPDGTKTVVKCQDGEPFDAEKGVALAILKKLYGGGKYNNVLRDLIKHATWDKKE